jgi:hypothetical protein
MSTFSEQRRARLSTQKLARAKTTILFGSLNLCVSKTEAAATFIVNGQLTATEAEHL